MADLVIRGMEMPETCHECPLNVSIYTYDGGDETCALNAWDGYSEQPKITRHPDCPIVPLPEGHGRLIDAERFRVILYRLKERLNDASAIHSLRWAIECLDKLESLVDAEREDE